MSCLYFCFILPECVEEERNTQSDVCFTGRGQWEESEVVNSTQGFYSLTGLKPGTEYHLVVMHGNYSQWEEVTWTMGPGICVEHCCSPPEASSSHM